MARRGKRQRRPMVSGGGRNKKLYTEDGGGTFVVTRTDRYSEEKRRLLNSMDWRKADLATAPAKDYGKGS